MRYLLKRPVSDARRALPLRRLLLALICAAMAIPGTAHAISLKAAIKVALEANPEIGEAIANREALEFELKQARGLYLPKVDIEGRYGAQNYDSPSTRSSGTDDDVLDRREFTAILSQRLFDGFNRRGERYRQASRVDSASFRVYERSEFIALNVIRQYLEIGRMMRIVDLSRDNLEYHRRVLSDFKVGESRGSISAADRQQVEERVYAAEARMIEADEDLNAARIRFFKLVGLPLDRYQKPPRAGSVIPPTLRDALSAARNANPRIKVAESDLDAAHARLKQSRSDFLPKVDLELRGRNGYDLDGVEGREEELRAEVILRWNLFKGGIDSANKQKQLRRVDEERFGLHRIHREVEEDVRLSWNRRQQQQKRLNRLNDQLASVVRLVDSYAEQFKVGDRSLLDLLDTQNTRFNTEVSVESASTDLAFTEFRLLASVGMLLKSMNIEAPEQSEDYARGEYRVPETPDGETNRRRKPSHRLFHRNLQ